jgi:hypothetical protein
VACCIVAAFLFGLLVRSLRKLRGLDPEPVPTIPKPVVRVDTGPGADTREPALTR